ncbi:gp65 [Alphaproteobacteria phage PhiJL001]|uniref:Gp65 n=1 Tax=Alphaproteobacteria phage PhiJL001 TaxID=2681607 RepID=Q5DN40_9CAUD|nr:gp65 [Alphaproteobacteria phage PhiJL001]AAT69541.1 gp65 [Alphaproteobacteria phage PhiJL001]
MLSEVRDSRTGARDMTRPLSPWDQRPRQRETLREFMKRCTAGNSVGECQRLWNESRH